MPSCLGTSGIRAREEHGELRLLGERRPHLLTVDHPFVAVTDRPGGERRQVRSCTRFAEQLGPLLLTGHDARQEPSLGGLLGEGADRRRGEHEPRPTWDARHVPPIEQLVHGPRLRLVETPSAVLDRPVRCDPPRGAEPGDHGADIQAATQRTQDTVVTRLGGVGPSLRKDLDEEPDQLVRHRVAH